MGMGLAMSCVVGTATARGQAWWRVTPGNIEARGDTLRVHVYAGPNPMTGRTVSVRGTDDAARRKRGGSSTACVSKRRRAAGRPR